MIVGSVQFGKYLDSAGGCREIGIFVYHFPSQLYFYNNIFTYVYYKEQFWIFLSGYVCYCVSKFNDVLINIVIAFDGISALWIYGAYYECEGLS